MTKITLGPWVNDNGLVSGRETRDRFAPSPSIDIFDAGEWPAELDDEAQANAALIAAAGTAAHKIAEMGYDPIKAVEALPALLVAYGKLVQAAAVVCAQDTGDVWTEDHGWVRPIMDITVNTLETALAGALLALGDKIMGVKE